jgi:acyl dehydratase
MMSQVAFSVPLEKRYFEDYAPGAVHEFGSIQVNEAQIIAFAQEYDPQPIHLDPVTAQASIFQGLIASGWQTAGLMMRLLVEHYLSPVASLGSPGVDELRWLKPVRPGDTLSVRTTVLSARRSQSKPDRGIVRTLVEVFNQHREVVMSMKAFNLLRRRESL